MAAMAKLKTDWILFLTILAMVGFGLVMLYSASSAVAELRYHVAALLFRGAPNRLGCGFVPGFDVLQAHAITASSIRRRGLFRVWESCWEYCWSWCISSIPARTAGSARGPRIIPAFRIRQARAHSFFGIFHLRVARSAINRAATLQQAFVAVVMLGFMVVVADLGTALVPVITAVIVFWVAGLKDVHGARGIAGCRAGYRGALFRKAIGSAA